METISMTQSRALDKDRNTYVVYLPLGPVECLLRTVSAVPGCGVYNTPLRARTTSPRHQAKVRRRTCNLTPKPVHVIYPRENEG